MDASMRITNAPALINKIDRLRDELIKHFEALVGPANIERQSRSATAIGQYHMQVETAALIRATEEFQSVIRELQEMWLFGQLDSGTSHQAPDQQETVQNAREVGNLLTKLLERERNRTGNDDGRVTNGAGEKMEHDHDNDDGDDSAPHEEEEAEDMMET